MLLVVLAVLGGIGALVYFKFIKQKPKTKGSDNLDDYDYGEDDTEQEDEDICHCVQAAHLMEVDLLHIGTMNGTLCGCDSAVNAFCMFLYDIAQIQ